MSNSNKLTLITVTLQEDKFVLCNNETGEIRYLSVGKFISVYYKHEFTIRNHFLKEFKTSESETHLEIDEAAQKQIEHLIWYNHQDNTDLKMPE